MSYFESYLFEKRTGHLTPEEKSAVRSLSSRADVSASDAYFEYNYGSFSANPLDILARYFDSLRFYIPHYGGRLAYRFDPEFVHVAKLKSFEVKNYITVSEIRGSIIIDVSLCNDGEYHDLETEFYDKENVFAEFYDDILNRDYRWLEILWCSAMNSQHQPDLSKSIRPTLMSEKMSERHHLLTDFFYESIDTINVIEKLTYRAEVYDFDPHDWIDHMDKKEMLSILTDLLYKPDKAQQQLIKALRDRHEEQGEPKKQARPITLKAINDLIEITREQREAEEQKVIEKEALKFSKKVTLLEAALWDRSATLIEEKKLASYKLSVQIMCAIKFAYHHHQQEEVFIERAESIRSRYSRCSSLMSQMDQLYLCTKTPHPPKTTESSYLGDSNKPKQPQIDWEIFNI